MSDPLWLTVPQAAGLLNMSPRWVEQEIAAGRLASVKAGRKRRILHADLARFAAERDDARVISIQRRHHRPLVPSNVRPPLPEYAR